MLLVIYKEPESINTMAEQANSTEELLQTIVINAENIKEWAILDVVDAPSINVRTSTKPISVKLPNGTNVCTTHECELALL